MAGSLRDRIGATAREVLTSRFFRNVLVLMSGSILAQLITLTFTPVLSRLYDPSAIGVLGVYVSMVTILALIASFRYDLAIMLPKEDAEAANILGLCGICVVAVTVLSGGLCVLFGPQIVAILAVMVNRKAADLTGWLWLMPVSILLSGFYIVLQSWCTRRKQFHRTAASQVARAVTAPGLQTVGGVCHLGTAALIGGAIVGDLCGVLVLVAQILKGDRHVIRGSLAVARIKHVAREYADFPKYSTPQSLMNSVSQSLPVLLLAPFFGPAVVGYYTFGVRIIQVPLNLVMNSLRSVLFQKASEVYNSGGDTYHLFKRTTKGLVLLVIGPALLIMLAAPTVASFVLGSQWHTAGEYARWLVLWLALMFCNVPAVLFGQLYRKQRALLIFDAFLLIARATAIIVGGTCHLTAINTIILYSIVGALFNTYLILWMWDYLRRQDRQVLADVPADVPADLPAALP